MSLRLNRIQWYKDRFILNNKSIGTKQTVKPTTHSKQSRDILVLHIIYLSGRVQNKEFDQI